MVMGAKESDSHPTIQQLNHPIHPTFAQKHYLCSPNNFLNQKSG
jgi:hypothetical protein